MEKNTTKNELPILKHHYIVLTINTVKYLYVFLNTNGIIYTYSNFSASYKYWHGKYVNCFLKNKGKIIRICVNFCECQSTCMYCTVYGLKMFLPENVKRSYMERRQVEVTFILLHCASFLFFTVAAVSCRAVTT